MRTVPAILAEIHKHKTCSQSQLYRYFAALGIKPLGARTRPALYPDDTAQKILNHLGIIQSSTDRRLPSMAALRKERRAA